MDKAAVGGEEDASGDEGPENDTPALLHARLAKWKARCRQLRMDIAAVQSDAASQSTSLQVAAATIV